MTEVANAAVSTADSATSKAASTAPFTATAVASGKASTLKSILGYDTDNTDKHSIPGHGHVEKPHEKLSDSNHTPVVHHPAPHRGSASPQYKTHTHHGHQKKPLLLTERPWAKEKKRHEHERGEKVRKRMEEADRERRHEDAEEQRRHQHERNEAENKRKHEEEQRKFQHGKLTERSRPYRYMCSELSGSRGQVLGTEIIKITDEDRERVRVSRDDYSTGKNIVTNHF